MLRSNNNISELQDLLDSDDELPTDYKEEPDIPAYLDDQRFEKIQFTWIKTDKIKTIPNKAVVPPASKKEAFCTQRGNNLIVTSNRNMIKKGILNEQDILCMKSVAAHTADDAALLWFINFLMYKDLQADYKFLKSCLVAAQENYGSSKKQYSQTFFPKTLINYFELVVK